MMCSAMAPKAKSAAGPRCSRGNAPRASRSSFSAAAGLVVKPATPPNRSSLSAAADLLVVGKLATPPKRISEEVGNATIAAAPVSHASKVQEDVVPEDVAVATDELGGQTFVEVRGLSGESLLKADFQLSDRVLSVKDRVLSTRSIPLWQQMLSFQGEMLDDQSTIGELNLLQGAVLDLVLNAGPSPEDLEALADVASAALTAGTKGMGTLRKNDICEVKAMKTPPRGCETVCMAALHLLAGLAPEIPVKRAGSPKNENWSGCKDMLKDPTSFMKQVLELPSCIDQGRVMESRVVKCRQLIDTIEGDSDSEKIQQVARCSLMCQQLITFLIGVVKYYDSVAEFRGRFGGATIIELRSHP